tara:strand:- start:745 stop:1107 length:363 start_codon:yes stop_codon:yes gene_type:complete
MKKLLLILLMFSFIFTQEPCEGTCLSEEETTNLFNNIKELEFDKNKYLEINKNLEKEIFMYIQKDSLYLSQIEDYKNVISLKNEMISLVKPKWYENRYLWFFFGVALTATSVKLAGEIND